jgi:hypothetical protein
MDMPVADSVEMIRIQDISSSPLNKQSSPRHENTANTLARTPQKPWSFHMSVLLLGLVGFTVALDATSLIVALPVSLLSLS